jgi:hypothetical protein
MTSPADRGNGAPGPVILALAVAFAAVVLPVALVRMPILWDFPNHFVRIWVLLGLAEGTPLATIYKADWSLAWTNIGIDLLAVLLGKLFPAQIVGSLLVALALVSAPVGVIALNRALYRGWHWWHVAAVMFAWNFVIVGGLLSFQIGLGLALLAAALEVRLASRSSWQVAAIRLLLAAGIMTVHVFALVFYVFLLAAMTFGPSRAPLATPASRRASLKLMIRASWPCLVPAVLLVAFAPKLPGAHVNAAAGEGARFTDSAISFPHPTVLEHLSIMLTPLKTYDLWADLLVVAVVASVPLYALWRRRIDMHVGLFGMSVILFVLSHFMPSFAAGTGFIDKRLPAMAGLMMAASVRPQIPASARGQALALVVMLLAVLTRAAWIGGIWIERQRDVDAIERASVSIPSGSAVLLVENFPGSVSDPSAPLGRYAHGEPIFRHLPTLVAIWRQSFVPTVFTAAGKQPLRVLPPWIDIAVPEGGMPRVEQLDDPAAVKDFHYLADWRRRFQYVLLVNGDMANIGTQIEQVAGLRLITDQGFARLYRIER